VELVGQQVNRDRFLNRGRPGGFDAVSRRLGRGQMHRAGRQEGGRQDQEEAEE
jgi:hypothetical protein